MTKGNPVAVACYAGHRDPQRPLRVRWRDTWYEVAEVASEWVEPGRRLFLVRLEDGTRLRLCYDEAQDQWTALA